MLRRNKKSVEMAEISWRYWDVAIIFFSLLASTSERRSPVFMMNSENSKNWTLRNAADTTLAITVLVPDAVQLISLCTVTLTQVYTTLGSTHEHGDVLLLRLCTSKYVKDLKQPRQAWCRVCLYLLRQHTHTHTLYCHITKRGISYFHSQEKFVNNNQNF